MKIRSLPYFTHPSRVLLFLEVRNQSCRKRTWNALTTFAAPVAPSHTYATKPYTGHGKSFRKSVYSYKRGGWDRDHARSTPSATITKPSKSGGGQTTMAVTVPQDSNKHKVQSHEKTILSKHARRGGRGRGNKKQSE